MTLESINTSFIVYVAKKFARDVSEDRVVSESQGSVTAVSRFAVPAKPGRRWQIGWLQFCHLEHRFFYCNFENKLIVFAVLCNIT